MGSSSPTCIEGESLVQEVSPKAPPQSHPWDVVFDPGMTCLTLPPPRPLPTPLCSDLAAGTEIRFRIQGPKVDVLNAFAEAFPRPLTDFVSPLLEDYSVFMGAPFMQLRLDTIRSKACWKWHQDFTTLRLITTLSGAGTQFLPDADRPEAISSCGVGEIGLFKGRLFNDHFRQTGHHACVHRSPPWTQISAPRLLLVMDTPQDFEM